MMNHHSGGQFLVVDSAGRATPMEDYAKASTAVALLANQGRFDAGRGRWTYHGDAMGILQQHFDAAVGGMRSDAFNGSAGLFQPRDLTQTLSKVLEEKLPPLNSRTVFPVNTEVQAGTKHWEQCRFYGTGKAVVYRGGPGQDIPEVGLSQAAVQAPVVYLVSAASIDLLEEMAANRTGLDINTRKLSRSRFALFELMNRWTFVGSEPYGLLGLLNHPYIDRAVSQVDYYFSTSSDDLLDDLYTWADYADNTSGGVFQSDTLLISNKLKNFLSSNRVPDTNGANLLEMLVRHKPHIKSIVGVRELDDAGGAGVHAMCFTRRGTGGGMDTSAEIMSVMEPVMLPAERGALASKIFMIAGYGGLNAQEVGNMVTVFVNGPT